MKKELLKGLSDEQIKKLGNCKNSEEILALAKAEGIELTDEQLEAVTGGGCFEQKKNHTNCTRCNSTDIEFSGSVLDNNGGLRCKCLSCGNEWSIPSPFH